MKILIVNISDIQGGAAKAAYRLHRSLLAQSIDSQMLVQNKISDDFTVQIFNHSILLKGLNILRQIIDSIPVRLYKKRSKTLFSPSWFGSSNIVDVINKINPDIVHMHWINGGMIRIEELSRIKAPIVWSLHDMWAFTGGCHYDETCEGYRNMCGNCKVLGSNKNNDLSTKIFNRKQKIFSNIESMTIVGLSRWLNDCSTNSTLLKNKKHINLPNPIDTSIFKPFDKEKARELWRLPKNKQLILFGAMGATSDPRKGFVELVQALLELKDEKVEFVVFGASQPQESHDFGLKTHYLGSLQDNVSLVTLYSAVDVMIVPSIQENLSNIIMESMACGTPVIGFDIGGNSDMIEHKTTGYLAGPFDAIDLKNGIEWVLNNPDYIKLRHNSREKILKEFDSVIVAKKYIKLYKDTLNEK